MTDITDPTRLDPPESAHIRLYGWGLAFLALPLFAIWAIVYGKEAGWDFQNYHWYDPYSLLNGRLGFDVVVAHHATYYNPYLDVPLFWIATHFPSWAGGAWLGVEAGIGAALIGGIAYRLVPLQHKPTRLVVAAFLALAALTGGGARGEIGKTSDDIAAGLGAIASLFVLIAGFERVLRAERRDLPLIALAGFFAGVSPGLKLTALPYAVGLGVAVLVLPGSLKQRAARTGIFGFGMILGVALCGGPWYLTMWHYAGNPVFPYFNDLFASPLVGPGSYRDESFLPHDALTRLIYPFLFSRNSLLVAEWKFRDIHILLAYIAVPVGALFALFRTKGATGHLVDPIKARLLMVMAAVTYLVWVFLFGIYRYLIPLEMLSGLVIVCSVSLIPLPMGRRIVVTVLLLGMAQILAWKGDEPRYDWSGPYVDVQVPTIADPDHTLILLTAASPAAYVIPSFPKQIPFLRIAGFTVQPDDNTYALGKEMHRRVAEHQGPILDLYWPVEYRSTVPALAAYGLKLDEANCKPVESNIQSPLIEGKPLQLCPVIRITTQ